MLRIGARLDNLVISDIRAMTRACAAVGGVNLGQGICDLATPAPVAARAIAAVDEGLSVYAPPEGVSGLREAVARDRSARLGRSVAVDEVVVTAGATGAFAAAVLALCEPGDQVLVPEPYYGYHVNTLVALGVEPVFVPLTGATWEVDFEALAAQVGPRTRAMVLCTPNNPCGKVWSAEELDRLGDFLGAHALFAISDEIYEHIVYDGRAHVAPASRPGLASRVVSISGGSKTFSVTGWRVGWITAEPALARRLAVAHDLLYVCAPTPLQHAVAAGLAMPKAYFDGLAASYQHKRDVLCAALVDAGLVPRVPRGAYYVLADVTRLKRATAREAAMHILESVGVASVSGRSFYRGAEGEGLVRFCFAKDDAVLEDAASRLRRL
ncbi:MAG: aminotransferase class I/II-fold pyridoxal phosphate-dependent enzyme [Myxococcales bacterium]|nr:aminotransferase class I/II-fold pyridoxal phosphate-dependent enzyme [Myxococcales bacterium]